MPKKGILRSLVYKLTASLHKDQKVRVDITAGIQSDCDNWWKYRKILITASKIKYLSSEKSKEQIFNWIKYTLWIDKNFDNSALKYGRENEEVARRKYTYRFYISKVWI